MIYPDEEKITCSYNLGGQLEKVHGYKSYDYDYVSKIGYDKFEQRIYLKYCNGAETFYTVSYHAYIPLLKFNNIVMDKIIKIFTAVPFRNLPVRIGSAYSNRLTLSRE